MTHDADHDPEFEAFLRRRSPMHRRLSQIDHAEPSDELDRIVLGRARDAIGAPSQQPIYRKSRWAMPLGLAATILIAFTVVLNIDHRRAASPQASSAAAQLAEKPAAAPPVSQLMARSRAESANTADFSAQHAESSASPAAPALPSETGAAERAQRQDAKRVAKTEAAPEPPAEQIARAARAAFSEGRAEAEADSTPLAEDVTTDNAADIVAQRDTTLASSRSLISGPAGSTVSAAVATPPPPSAPAPDVHASPETWLAEINRLRAAGKNDEADRELAAFRRAYPAHPGYSLAQPPTR